MNLLEMTGTIIKSMVRALRHMAVNQRSQLVWLINIALAAASYSAAYAIRFDTVVLPSKMVDIWLMSLPIAVALKILLLLRFKVFTGLWRYVGAHDLLRMSKALSAYAVLFVTLTMLTWGHRIPRSVYLLDFLLSLLLFSGVRLSVRLYREFRMDAGKHRRSKRFLIIGAGDAAEIAARSLLHEQNSNNTIAGYIDDDPQKHGRLIHGVPVLGGRNKTADAIRTLRVSDVLFAISDAPKDLTEYIVSACSGLDVSFRILPSFCDIATGRIEVQHIRNVEIEDLLGRRPVRLDSTDIRADLQGESVLVTGAGGSIGSELARQIAQLSPSRLLLLDAAETPLFEIQQEILNAYPTLHLETLLCNIKNEQAVLKSFERYRPTRVYHAAAYKHVPMLEAHPEQAVLNNVCGTRYLAEAAYRTGVKRFAMISTDKAVHPSSIMGASKRICELVVFSMPEGNGTRFAAVRFGNVLGSNGSVIPTFRRQIADGGPVTVTHPDMTRFFMTIPEAVQLVLHCGSMAERNDIFVLDMGTPVRIIDLARNMIRLSGLEPDRDIEIKITGLRPGEKMHEELVTYGEDLQPTSIDKINVLRRRPPPLAPSDIIEQVNRMEELAKDGLTDAVKDAIWSLIRMDSDAALTGETKTLSSVNRNMVG
jgi:FlaA1/EpsC-like NDP-sugar epimerase